MIVEGGDNRMMQGTLQRILDRNGCKASLCQAEHPLLSPAAGVAQSEDCQ